MIVTTKHHPTPEERDERVSVPIPADVAVEAFLAVNPDSEPGGNPATDAGAPDRPTTTPAQTSAVRPTT